MIIHFVRWFICFDQKHMFSFISLCTFIIACSVFFIFFFSFERSYSQSVFSIPFYSRAYVYVYRMFDVQFCLDINVYTLLWNTCRNLWKISFAKRYYQITNRNEKIKQKICHIISFLDSIWLNILIFLFHSSIFIVFSNKSKQKSIVYFVFS